MTGQALVRKLQIKPGMRMAVIRPPQGYPGRLAGLPPGAVIAKGEEADLDFIQVFARNRAELESLLPGALARLKPDGLFWVCYPKLTAEEASDLSREVLWEVASKLGIRPVAQIAIDQVWSAMRFRPAGKIKSAGPGPAARRAAPKDKTVVVPEDFKKALAKNKTAQARFEILSYTHRKEYVRWIEEAKKPETRARRIANILEMLSSGGSR